MKGIKFQNIVVVLSIGATIFIYGCSSHGNPNTSTGKSQISNNSYTVDTNMNKFKDDNITNEKYNSDELKQVSKEIQQIKNNPNGPDILEKMVLVGGTGSLTKVYTNLADKLINNILNNRSIDNLQNKVGKKRKFKITVYNENNKPLSKVKIYLWGYLLGETNKNGKLIKIIKIPRIYDYMYFQAYKSGYLWGFKKINAINLDGSLISLTFRLKKDFIKKVNNIDKFEIKNQKISILAFTKCLTLNKNGQCYSGKGEIEIGYVNPLERDRLSIPTQAIYSGKLVHLQSNGMAFIKFKDKNGNLLKLNPNFDGTIKICYNVGEKAIQERNNQRWTLEGKQSDGYWWFDKNLGVWKLDKNAKITIKNGKFCFETKHIY